MLAVMLLLGGGQRLECGFTASRTEQTVTGNPVLHLVYAQALLIAHKGYAAGT